MLTKNDCQNNIELELINLNLGKQHLLAALDSGDRQAFLSALHKIMDAILEELESD